MQCPFWTKACPQLCLCQACWEVPCFLHKKLKCLYNVSARLGSCTFFGNYTTSQLYKLVLFILEVHHSKCESGKERGIYFRNRGDEKYEFSQAQFDKCNLGITKGNSTACVIRRRSEYIFIGCSDLQIYESMIFSRHTISQAKPVGFAWETKVLAN